MLNKKDPLIESVQKIMKENEIRRTVTKNLNEELGIQSINNLPHELHGRYTSILEQNITAALLGEKVEMSKADIAGLKEPHNDIDEKDLAALRAGEHKKKPVAEEKKMKGDDPCWKGYEMIGMKKKGGREVPNCVPMKEQAAGNPEKDPYREQQAGSVETMPVPKPKPKPMIGKPDQDALSDKIKSIKEEQLNELGNQTMLNYLGKGAPDSDAIEDMGRSFYRQGKATKILSKYSKGMNRATAALKKRGMSDDQIMSGTAKAASKFAEKEPRKLQKLTEKITAKTDMGSAIKEFKASESKQLAGRSQEDRRKAAIAAVLQARREKK